MTVRTETHARDCDCVLCEMAAGPKCKQHASCAKRDGHRGPCATRGVVAARLAEWFIREAVDDFRRTFLRGAP